MKSKKKKEGLESFLNQKDLKALLLKRQANFSWMTCGGLNLVGITTEMGATSLLITENSKFVISNNIEAPRMIDEEGLEKQGFVVKTFPWYEDQEVSIVKELVGDGPLGSDVPFPNAMMLAEDVARLRYSLTPEEHGTISMAGRKGFPGIGKNGDEDEEGRKGIRGRGKALQRILERSNRSYHLDVRSG